MLADIPLEEILQNIDGALWIGSLSSGAIWIRFGLPKAFQSLTDQGEVNSQIRVVSNPTGLLKIQPDWPLLAYCFCITKQIQ